MKCAWTITANEIVVLVNLANPVMILLLGIRGATIAECSSNSSVEWKKLTNEEKDVCRESEEAQRR